MEYYKLFNLEKEPFSNTPDPDFFYRSNRHARCLQQLEIAIRLHRGLCIVCGEVGTGKTTLCRHLIRALSADETMDVHLVLDPGFDRTEDFAAAVNEMINGREKAAACTSIPEHKEMIKQRLFETGVDKAGNLVLIIDEGQKLSSGCIEFLRELLNYETNAHKLIQIVIFAQNEIEAILAAHPNFADRAALYDRLAPLGRKETARLIRFRLRQAAAGRQDAKLPEFTFRALSRIHRLSRGYPRRAVHLAHHVLLLMLIQGGNRVTPAVVNRAARRLPERPLGGGRLFRLKTGAAGIASAALVLAGLAAAWHGSLLPGSKPQAVSIVTDRPAQPGPRPVPAEKTEIRARAPSDTNMAAAAMPAAGEHEKQRPDPPEHLGRIRIRRGERLWDTVERVYGSPSPGIIDRIQQANADMENPDRIRAGQQVRLPATGMRPAKPDERYWIAVKKSADIGKIYEFTTTAQYRGLRMISVWDPESGLFHAAVTSRPFAGYEQAFRALANLPGTLAGRAEILDLSGGPIRLLAGKSKKGGQRLTEPEKTMKQN